MAVALAIQLEVPPLQQDRQILGLLQLHQENSFAYRVQNAGRHIDDVTRMHVDLVEQTEHRVDVLVHHQRLELVDPHVLLQAQVDHATVEDVPRLSFAVRPAEVLSDERGVRVCMYGQALTGIQQLDEQAAVGPEAFEMCSSQPRFRLPLDRGFQGSTVGKYRDTERLLAGKCRC